MHWWKKGGGGKKGTRVVFRFLGGEKGTGVVFRFLESFFGAAAGGVGIPGRVRLPWQRTHSGCADPNRAWDGSAPRRGELTSTAFLKPQAEYSSPLVHYVNPIADRNSRRGLLRLSSTRPLIPG
jgi:hypothetical protein